MADGSQVIVQTRESGGGMPTGAVVLGRFVAQPGAATGLAYVVEKVAEAAKLGLPGKFNVCVTEIIVGSVSYRQPVQPACFGEIIPVGTLQIDGWHSAITTGQHVLVQLAQPIPDDTFGR
jgi:hypothetical protein